MKNQLKIRMSLMKNQLKRRRFVTFNKYIYIYIYIYMTIKKGEKNEKMWYIDIVGNQK